MLDAIRPTLLPVAFCILASILMVMAPPRMTEAQSRRYPATRKVDQVDDYHGTRVADPYRWLEDANAPETRAWIEAQNAVTEGFLSAIPERGRIRDRITKLFNYEKFSLPTKEGDLYFFSRNEGLQNQSVLYVAKSLTDTPRVLLDPNTLAKDGTVALTGTSVSKDGKYLAYGVAASGSDWQEWRVRDIATGKDRTDQLKWTKFTNAAWTHDSKGFFYSRYDEPKSGQEFQQQNFFHKIFYHRLGTPQAEDVLIFERPDQKEWYVSASVTDDGRYLLIYTHRGTDPEDRVFVQDLKEPKSPVIGAGAPHIRELFGKGDAQYTVVENEGTKFWVETDKGAPRGRLIEVDLDDPAPERWKEVIPQAAEKLNSVHLFADRFYANYLKDAHTQIRVFGLDGKPLGEVALPGLGSAGGFGGKRGDTETFYAYTSFTTPPAIYRYDLKAGRSEVFKKPTVAFNESDFETKQVFYKSKDGTRVPMFIVHRKGLKLDGTNPTYLYGYGGFNSSQVPSFSSSMLAWMEMGGVYAVANLRGGGEYGQEWHDAGRLKNKQNVFDDFIAAGEWLIANNYTSTPKLAIGGGSNGGLLVGACMTQRPDLFGAALPAVGVMDMLRFHKFTVGWGWTSDYGSSDDPEQFKTLLAYSPLHNIRSGTKYPATLVTTSDHDDRVVPAHSFKFTAALQEAQAGDKPILIRVETKAGHGAGKPTSKQIEEAADKWAFLVRTLNISVPDSFGKK